MFLSLFPGRKWGKNSGFAVYTPLPFFILATFVSLCFTNNFWQIHITRHHCHHVLLITWSDPWNDSCSRKETSKKKNLIGHLKYTMETGSRCLPGMRLILASGETLSKLICWSVGLRIARSALTVTRSKLCFFIFKKKSKR